MRHSNNKLMILFCINIIIFLSGCTHIPQKDTTTIPIIRGVTSISVPLFTNESHQYGLEEIFTNLFIKEIVYDGRLQIVNTQPSDLTVKGRVLIYEKSPVSYNEYNIDRYRLFIQIEMIMLKSSNEVIWKKVIGDFIDFIPSSSTLISKGFVAKEEDTVAQELCQRICSQAVVEIISIITCPLD
ncbi:MAG: LPS assembly lipoprotein LptE [Candidatus Desantisbacteria bacterium]